MKALIVVIALTAMTASAQTNPSADAVRIETEKMRAEFIKAQETAQARAIEREKAIAVGRINTNALVAPTNESVEHLRRPTWVNTNANSEGLGFAIQALERHFPGVSTNFTPAQRALTNAPPDVVARRAAVAAATNSPAQTNQSK